MQKLDSFDPTSLQQASSRLQLWTDFLNKTQVRRMVELGVYRGDFAAQMLADCPAIERYYMLDPWRHLDQWNKPANKSDDIFTQFLDETKQKTEFAADKRVILQGKTTEVINEIADDELDFGYIDGDHTLKGISIDLMRLYPKVRNGGWIGGDDFSRTIWQHKTEFEPTLVFPFAVYFAEAMGDKIYALPFGQFLIEKKGTEEFEFVDTTGGYGDLSLKSHLHPTALFKKRLKEKFPILEKLF